MSSDKQVLREKIWDALQKSGDDLFPGAKGRIPNFKGRDEAAKRFAETSTYRNANPIKVNPDSPQTPVRERALRDGKILYMSVPKLAKRNCFLELDPYSMKGDPLDWASLTGAPENGSPIQPGSMHPVDVIVTGLVGGYPTDKRLGKGGGYSNLEFAILLEFGLIDRSVPIITTLPPTQKLDQGKIPNEPQDITLSWFFLPDRLIKEQQNTIPKLSELIDDSSQPAGDTKS